MTELEPLFLNGPPAEINSQEMRQAFDHRTEGLFDTGDLLVSAGASGISVDVAAGVAYVQGDAITAQGLYRCRNDAAVNSDDFQAGGMAAADGSDPRVDRIVARVYDDDADSSGLRTWRFEVVAGTPTTGATLSNLNGAAAVPASALLLANVLVPAGASSLTANEIANAAALSRSAVVVGPEKATGIYPWRTIIERNLQWKTGSTLLTGSGSFPATTPCWIGADGRADVLADAELDDGSASAVFRLDSSLLGVGVGTVQARLIATIAHGAVVATTSWIAALHSASGGGSTAGGARFTDGAQIGSVSVPAFGGGLINTENGGAFTCPASELCVITLQAGNGFTAGSHAFAASVQLQVRVNA